MKKDINLHFAKGVTLKELGFCNEFINFIKKDIHKKYKRKLYEHFLSLNKEQVAKILQEGYDTGLSNAKLERITSVPAPTLRVWARREKENYKNKLYLFLKNSKEEELIKYFENIKQYERKKYLNDEEISKITKIQVPVLKDWKRRAADDYRNKFYHYLKQLDKKELEQYFSSDFPSENLKALPDEELCKILDISFIAFMTWKCSTKKEYKNKIYNFLRFSPKEKLQNIFNDKNDEKYNISDEELSAIANISFTSLQNWKNEDFSGYRNKIYHFLKGFSPKEINFIFNNGSFEAKNYIKDSIISKISKIPLETLSDWKAQKEKEKYRIYIFLKNRTEKELKEIFH